MMGPRDHSCVENGYFEDMTNKIAALGTRGTEILAVRLLACGRRITKDRQRMSNALFISRVSTPVIVR